jgi:hypothetical protein
MADHTEFWVAAAAAAPIIALATQVAVTQSVSAMYVRKALHVSKSEQLRRAEKSVRRFAVIEYTIAVGNIGLQTAVLLTAMLSLGTGKDWWPTGYETALLITGLSLVAISALMAAGLIRTKEELDQLQLRSGADRQARSRILKSVGVSGGRAPRRR